MFIALALWCLGHCFSEAIPCLLSCNDVFKVLRRHGRDAGSVNESHLNHWVLIFQCSVTPMPSHHGLDKVCSLWVSYHQAQRLVLDTVKMVWEPKYALFPWNGVRRRRGRQLLNGGLQTPRPISLSVVEGHCGDIFPEGCSRRERMK